MDRGDKAVRFINFLSHTKGKWAGKGFALRPWQEHKIIRPLFGTVTADGLRRYRQAFIFLPRKNGKSELCAAMALYLLCADAEPGGEIYSAAADRDQASLVFNIAAQMVRQTPALARTCKIIDSQKRIVVAKTGSFYRAISSEANTKHGFNASGIIYDEIHAAPNRELWDVLTTSMGSREQPLTVGITTAGTDQTSLAYELFDYARKVRDGVIVDPTFLPVLYYAEEGEGWMDEKVWHRVNPALGDFRSLEEMQQYCLEAQALPIRENTFRRLYLNQWTQQADRWLSLNIWGDNAGTVAEADLAGHTCYGGLDLSSVSDMTALVLVFPQEDGTLKVLPFFWVPEGRLHDSGNRYRAHYTAWAGQGWLRTTEGDALNYDQIETDLLAITERFRVLQLNIDILFQGHQMEQRLREKHGLPMVAMRTGMISMSPPTKELERRLLSRQLCHGRHPILDWQADNVAVKQDHLGNIMPHKTSSQGKIDGIVALVMALNGYMHGEEEFTSKYDTEDLTVV